MDRDLFSTYAAQVNRGLRSFYRHQLRMAEFELLRERYEHDNKSEADSDLLG